MKKKSLLNILYKHNLDIADIPDEARCELINDCLRLGDNSRHCRPELPFNIATMIRANCESKGILQDPQKASQLEKILDGYSNSFIEYYNSKDYRKISIFSELLSTGFFKTMQDIDECILGSIQIPICKVIPSIIDKKHIQESSWILRSFYVNDLELAKKMFALGVPCNASSKGNTPLLRSISRFNMKQIKLAIEISPHDQFGGTQINQYFGTPLIELMKSKAKPDFLMACLNRMQELKIPLNYNVTDFKGDTPLSALSRKSDCLKYISVAEHLINNGSVIPYKNINPAFLSIYEKKVLNETLTNTQPNQEQSAKDKKIAIKI